LGMFWFLYKKAYRTAAIFFLVLAAIIGIYEIFEIKASGASFGLAVVAGMSGADYVESEYKRKYVYCGDIEARNERNAIVKFSLSQNR
ncbi:MAG: DUF2628 domain-containing protein, partial [Negativicutes bacterium]|nr:DUF2628 domain-containing protein [Negativicutes bacterium]